LGMVMGTITQRSIIHHRNHSADLIH